MKDASVLRVFFGKASLTNHILFLCIEQLLCMLLFAGYWHQVRSYGSKNMAVSVLFSRLTEFDPTNCENAKLEYTPLSDVNMVWTYPGHGPQTMGNVDPFEMKYATMPNFIFYIIYFVFFFYGHGF